MMNTRNIFGFQLLDIPTNLATDKYLERVRVGAARNLHYRAGERAPVSESIPRYGFPPGPTTLSTDWVTTDFHRPRITSEYNDQVANWDRLGEADTRRGRTGNSWTPSPVRKSDTEEDDHIGLRS